MARTRTQTADGPEIYVKKQVARRWLQEARTGERVLFFSPYVTAPCAVQILTASAGKRELYTVFEAKSFAVRASSLHALERLLDNGVEVYHVEKLHAKIMLVPGHLVVIGSQNLTKKGKENLEANVLLRDHASIEQVQGEVAPWIGLRVRVTRGMISDMRASIRELQKAFAEADARAAEIDAGVRDKEHERTKARERAEAERQRLEAERRRRAAEREQVRSRIRAAIDRARAARRSADGEVRAYNQSFDMSLIADPRTTYTEWRVGSGRHRLLPTHRYLCIHENTCMLGWVRVCRTRITQVETRINRSEGVFFQGRRYKVLLAAEWGERELGSHNLRISLEDAEKNRAIVKCAFTVDSLEVVSSQWTNRTLDKVPELCESIRCDADQLRTQLITLIVSPFKYARNLCGVKADRFFGPWRSRFRVRMALVEGGSVLAAARIPPA